MRTTFGRIFRSLVALFVRPVLCMVGAIAIAPSVCSASGECPEDVNGAVLWGEGCPMGYIEVDLRSGTIDTSSWYLGYGWAASIYDYAVFLTRDGRMMTVVGGYDRFSGDARYEIPEDRAYKWVLFLDNEEEVGRGLASPVVDDPAYVGVSAAETGNMLFQRAFRLTGR